MAGRMQGALGSYEQAHEVSARIKFRRALVLTVMTLIVPGSAQLAVGNKGIGRIALRIWLGLIVLALLLIGLSMLSRTAVFWLLTNGLVLFLVRWGLLALAGFWVYLLFDAWRLGAPMEMGRRHRLVMTGLNTVLCVAAVSVALFASNVVAVQTDFMASVFGDQASSEAEEGRYNILLLGGDAGEGRDGLRPDSLTLASIDAETGRTVLIGLPRNLQNVPFRDGSVMNREFPRGFDCEDCLLNAVNTWAQDNAALFDEPDPGMQATKDAVEGVTGLKVNYYAMINMRGFVRLVDAVGGLRINVRDRVAIGGGTSPIYGYIEPGERVLTGREVLWFSRSRAQSSDYARMGRQKCVLAAMAQQLSPRAALFNVKELAESGKEMLDTDIPTRDLDVLIDLALKARGLPMSTVSLVPPKVDTSDPDYAAIHRMVAEAIAQAEAGADEGGQEEPTSGGAATSTGPEGEEPSPEPTDPQKVDESSNNADDVAATC